MRVQASPEGTGGVPRTLIVMDDEPPSSGGPSLPTACPIASIATLSAMRQDIDRPTALRGKASVTAARQSRPSLADM